MSRIIILFFFSLSVNHVTAQKKIIDFAAIKQWEKLGNYEISNDGEYIWYKKSSQINGDSLVVVAANGTYSKSFPHFSMAKFTSDAKFLIFKSEEKIYYLSLKTRQLSHIKGASAFSMPMENLGQWVAFQINEDLLLKDLKNNREQHYKGISALRFDREGQTLLVKNRSALNWLSLSDNKQKVIYNGSKITNVNFDRTGNKIVFGVTEEDNSKSLYFYQVGWDSAKLIVDYKSVPQKAEFVLSNDQAWFSKDGNTLFFNFKYYKRKVNVKNDTVLTSKVDIWHYRDDRLQTQQLLNPNDIDSRSYIAAISTQKFDKIRQLENRDSVFIEPPLGRFGIIKNVTNESEVFWDESRAARYRLVDVNSGQHLQFMPDDNQNFYMSLSKNEKYILYCDTISQNYYCYEIATRETKCLTENIDTPDDFKDIARNRNIKFSFAGWLKDDKAIIIYDKYDIWMLDPLGKKKPINITTGYGRRQKIILRLGIPFEEISNYKLGEAVLLSGLNEKTKFNYFFKTKLAKVEKIMETYSGPTVNYFPGLFFGAPPPPIRALNSDVYILQRQSDKEAPNLFLTKDFKVFRAISNIKPQETYNWMTSSLVSWPTGDGTSRYGILYKPENFDSLCKYPIIFHYYELRSDECFRYQEPYLSEGGMSIAWYVSRGYIVFIPDIWIQPVYRGRSALESVVSVAKYLTHKYPWIDKNRMGLQGHSLGGFETNYIISNCRIFAAAQASSGPTDLVSCYGGVGFGGKSLAELHEVGQLQLRTSPWERPDVYIENSPLFRVEKITTPLLLMHNKGDDAVPFAQAVELFTALRRLRKKVWLLQYDEQDHTLNDQDSKLDFTIRQQQFFDHYLMKKLPPKWMTQSVQAKFKGVVSGLNLDTTNSNP